MNHPHKSQSAAMDRAGELPDGEQLRDGEFTMSDLISSVQAALAAKQEEVARLREALGNLLHIIDEPAASAVGMERELRYIDHARAMLNPNQGEPE